MKRSVFFTFFLVISLNIFSSNTILFGQNLEVYSSTESPLNIEDLITTTISGPGFEILDINFCGTAESMGYFRNAENAIQMEQGIILTTGIIKSNAFSMINPASVEASGDNGSTIYDENLGEIAGSTPLHNVVKCEITFRPSSDLLQFQYVFASEEYPEFTCNAFNDLIGFFISGPSPNGGIYYSENIAMIPDTDLPVSINNVHNGNPNLQDCPPINPEYYNDNSASTDFIFDAYLDVFEAKVAVIPNEEYVLKLSIADVGDKEKDSAVFLGKGSFISTTTETVIPLSETSIDVFPNPTKGVLSIENIEADLIELFDYSGQNVMTVQHPKQSLDLSMLEKGIYFLKIAANNQVYSTKIVKE